MTITPFCISSPPPVSGTIYGVVLNDHHSIARFGTAVDDAPYKGAPKAPAMYLKPANTVVGNGAAITLPADESAVEIGATVGIVIGAPAARLSTDTAMDVVAGYALVADLSLPHSSYYRPAIREKCFDGACPVAEVRPANEIGTLSTIVLTTFIGGQPVAERSLADLVRDVPQLLTDVTEFMTLSVGDMLLVGVEYLAPQAAAGNQVRITAGPLGSLEFSIHTRTEALTS